MLFTALPLSCYLPLGEKDAITKLVNLFMPSREQSGLALSRFTEGPKVIKYSEKYKLVFSLLSEDASKGGISQWDAASALERAFTARLDQCLKYLNNSTRRSRVPLAKVTQRLA